jgi:hypothetical protein
MPTSKYISLYPDAYNNPNIVSPPRDVESSHHAVNRRIPRDASVWSVWSVLVWFGLVWFGLIWFDSVDSVRYRLAALTLHQTVMGEISNFTKPKNRLIDTC